MRNEARRLREDPTAIEELARRELGLIKPGEKVFIELIGSEKILDERREKRAELRAKRREEVEKAMQEQQANVEASGGPRPFVARARRALDAGENQIVLELTEIVLDVHPSLDHTS